MSESRRQRAKAAARSAWDILRETFEETWKQVQQAQLLQVASSLAYTTILSLIPLLAMSFAIFKAFGGMEKLLDTIQPFILSNLAEGTSDEVIGRLQEFIDKAHTRAVGAGGFLGLVLTSVTMLWSIEKSINKVWQARVTRSWFNRLATYWMFITLGPVALAFALGFVTSQEMPVASILPSGVAIFGVTVAVFYAIFKYVPNTRVYWKYALLSSVVTSAFWNIAREGYALYTRKVVTTSAIYGSLSAVPILLLWIYIVWVIILSGAAFTAALQKRIPETSIK